MVYHTQVLAIRSVGLHHVQRIFVAWLLMSSAVLGVAVIKFKFSSWAQLAHFHPLIAEPFDLEKLEGIRIVQRYAKSVAALSSDIWDKANQRNILGRFLVQRDHNLLASQLLYNGLVPWLALPYNDHNSTNRRKYI